MTDLIEALCNPLLVTDERFDLTREAAAEIKRLRALVRDAYNEGFNQGMREVQTSRGGLAFVDSKARAALAGKVQP